MISRFRSYEVEGIPDAGPCTKVASLILDQVVCRTVFGALELLTREPSEGLPTGELEGDPDLLWFKPQDFFNEWETPPINADVATL